MSGLPSTNLRALCRPSGPENPHMPSYYVRSGAIDANKARRASANSATPCAVTRFQSSPQQRNN
eukprot:1933117-Amphidinium_carterae.2